MERRGFIGSLVAMGTAMLAPWRMAMAKVTVKPAKMPVPESALDEIGIKMAQSLFKRIGSKCRGHGGELDLQKPCKGIRAQVAHVATVMDNAHAAARFGEDGEIEMCVDVLAMRIEQEGRPVRVLYLHGLGCDMPVKPFYSRNHCIQLAGNVSSAPFLACAMSVSMDDGGAIRFIFEMGYIPA